MRKILSILIATIAIFTTPVRAQDFSWSSDNSHDTIFALNYVNLTPVIDTVTNNTGGALTLKWKVIASNFPADWLAGTGICDNNTCYGNSGNDLWNPATNSGNTKTTNPYAGHTTLGDFHFYSTLGASGGTYYITITMYNPSTGGTADTMTYIVSKLPTSVANVTTSQDDIILYPNPAADNVNILFNPDSGVKTISIHNVIGKMLSIYKVSGNSAQLSLNNVPSGVYFVRLQDAQGGVIATRRFTRQ